MLIPFLTRLLARPVRKNSGMMHHGGRVKLGRGLLGIGLGLALAACQTVESTVDRTVNTVTGRSNIPFGTPGHVAGFLGGVAADEPRAAIVARDILSGGGSAVDAAVAGAFTMAVTLPSRAGLGGGAMLVRHTGRVGHPLGGEGDGEGEGEKMNAHQRGGDQGRGVRCRGTTSLT